MATDATSEISYYLSIPRAEKGQLANLRHWSHLKMGDEEGLVWVKGFSEAEVQSVEVMSVPYKELYREVGPKLYKIDSRLPERNIPSVLWSGIDRAISVEVSSYNHNFFGLSEQIPIKLVPSAQEQTVIAQMVPLKELSAYVENAAQIRLKPIKWLIIGEEALLMGVPLLPLNGRSYWKQESFLIPAGFQLNIPLLAPALGDRLDAKRECWTLMKEDGSYIQTKKAYFKDLSIGSFRLSMRTKESGA